MEEATLWLDELMRGFSTTWNELSTQFLDQFSPPSKILQLKEEINNFRELHSVTLYETWLRIKKKL